MPVVVEAIVVGVTVVVVGSNVVVVKGGGGVHTQLWLDVDKRVPALHNSNVPIPLQERS